MTPEQQQKWVEKFQPGVYLHWNVGHYYAFNLHRRDEDDRIAVSYSNAYSRQGIPHTSRLFFPEVNVKAWLDPVNGNGYNFQEFLATTELFHHLSGDLYWEAKHNKFLNVINLEGGVEYLSALSLLRIDRKKYEVLLESFLADSVPRFKYVGQTIPGDK